MQNQIRPTKTDVHPWLTIGGKQVVQSRYDGQFTREQVRRHAQNISNRLNAQFPEISHFSVAIRYAGTIEWRGAKFTRTGERVVLHNADGYDLDSPDDLGGFIIYYSL